MSKSDQFLKKNQNGLEGIQADKKHSKKEEKGQESQPEVVLKAKTRCFSDIQEKSITWLWEGRLACGKLNMMAGDPGDGKSTVSVDMAARITSGKPWPDGKPNQAGGVIIISAEDDAADTIKPRFMAAGGNPSRMHTLDGVTRTNIEGVKREGYFNLVNDLDALEELIVSKNARFVIIDPMSAYLSGVDSHKNAELRSVLGPLSDLAAKTNVCVLAISHLNKSTQQAQYRIIGSLAFTAAARSTWITAKDKKNPERRLLLPVKNNLAPDTGGLAYSLRASENKADIPIVVAWEKDPVYITAQQALAPPDRSNSKLDDAKDWLRAILENGAVDVNEIRKMASEREGASWRTIETAKKELGIISDLDGSPRYNGKSMWKLNTATSPLSDVAVLRNNEKALF